MTSAQLHQMVEGMEKALLRLKAEVAKMERAIAEVNKNMAERAKLQGGIKCLPKNR